MKDLTFLSVPTYIFLCLCVKEREREGERELCGVCVGAEATSYLHCNYIILLFINIFVVKSNS